MSRFEKWDNGKPVKAEPMKWVAKLMDSDIPALAFKCHFLLHHVMNIILLLSISNLIISRSYMLHATCLGRGHLDSRAHPPQHCSPRVYILFLHNLVWQISWSTWICCKWFGCATLAQNSDRIADPIEVSPYFWTHFPQRTLTSSQASKLPIVRNYHPPTNRLNSVSVELRAKLKMNSFKFSCT